MYDEEYEDELEAMAGHDVFDEDEVDEEEVYTLTEEGATQLTEWIVALRANGNYNLNTPGGIADAAGYLLGTGLTDDLGKDEVMVMLCFGQSAWKLLDAEDQV